MIVGGTLPPDWAEGKTNQGRIQPPPKGMVSSPPEKVATPQNRILNNVLLAVNGNLEFGSPTNGPINIKGAWGETTTPAIADSQFTVTHNLGYIPTGWFTVAIDKAGILYAGAVEVTLWTTTQLVLKCSVASVKVKVFVI